MGDERGAPAARAGAELHRVEDDASGGIGARWGEADDGTEMGGGRAMITELMLGFEAEI